MTMGNKARVGENEKEMKFLEEEKARKYSMNEVKNGQSKFSNMSLNRRSQGLKRHTATALNFDQIRQFMIESSPTKTPKIESTFSIQLHSSK